MKLYLKWAKAPQSADTAYPVSEVILNACPLSAYVLEIKGGTTVNWLQALSYLEKRLMRLAGYELVTAAPQQGAPTLTLEGGVKPLRSEIGYRVTETEHGAKISFGSTVGALAGITLFANTYLPATATGELHLTLTEGEGEIGRGAARPPLTESTTTRAMTYNVLGVSDRTELISASVIAGTPDFVGMQEYFSGAALCASLRRAGYKMACEKLNTASPYSIRTNNVKYEHIGEACCTPIFYRAADWELVEEIAYLFHWQNRCPHTNTKSVAFAVFASKSEPEKRVLVVNFHAALVLPDYQNHYLRFPEGEHCRPGLTEKMYGKAWRLANNKELLREIDEMREKYAGLTVVLIGDMNGVREEESIQLFDQHEALSHILDLAPAAHCDNGPTFHPVGSDNYVHKVPIDHVFVSHATVTVGGCLVARDELALDSSDHCPVMADFSFV